MRDLNLLGQIILLIVFVLVPLIKFIVRQVRKRLEGRIPEDTSVPQVDRQAQATPETLPTARGSRNRVTGGKAPIVQAPLEKDRFALKTLLGTPHDARRGIVLMTILGPCRALEPSDNPIPTLSLHRQKVSVQSHKA